jgi:hypothetical protein
MIEDKYIGLALAMSSALAIGMFFLEYDRLRHTNNISGTSFVITKKVRRA